MAHSNKFPARLNRQGLVDYLAFITADVQYHQAMIAELRAKTVRCQDAVALFVALGQGWWGTDAEIAGADGSKG